ncbi:MAG: NADH:flavin oxidoreductase/NADH oxidase [Vulcanimicrobiaceae bacterium]
MSPTLFSPISLRSVTFDNRIVVSPMCQYSAHAGSAGDWHVVNLGHLALGGPGLVFFEATHVSAEGRITPNCLGLYNDENEIAIARVVRFLRDYTPVKIGIQLAHAGRKGATLPPWEGGGPVGDARTWQTVAPSALPYDDTWRTPVALDARGMQKVRDDFVAAAGRAARLGIDVVELHFAHGYLAHQFLSPLSNVRTDEYGGSLENRMRFPLELFDAVRRAWPGTKPLGVRVSATDYVEGGWTLEETVVLASQLAARGCDFVDVSSGGLSPLQTLTPEPGYQVGFSRAVREATGIATIAVGLIVDPLHAERIVAGGDADFVALARGFLRDPRWGWNAADALGAQAFCPPQYRRAYTRMPKPNPR